MNPLALVGMAALGLLAVFIFLGANERSTRNLEINQQKHELESAQFDRDFSKFLNDEKLTYRCKFSKLATLRHAEIYSAHLL